jgi:hypothetical protein
MDARTPHGFFTDLHPHDFDGQFEFTARASQPQLHVGIAVGVEPTVIRNVTVRSVNDDIASVNENGTSGGFDFQNASVGNEPKPGAFAVETATVTSNSRDADATRVKVDGSVRRIALLAERRTDILLARPTTWPTGVRADPTTVEGRAAWYSFAFWLRAAAGWYLDVDPQELQAGMRTFSEKGEATAEAYMCDQLENGAGYCTEIARPERFVEVLAQANPLVTGTLASAWTNRTSLGGHALPHAVECDTSCSRCLREYGNMSFHGLLDWRLSLDVARLAQDPAAIIDTVTPWADGVENPWQSMAKRVASALEGLGYTAKGDSAGLATFAKKLQSGVVTVLVVRHPLWSDDHPVWREAVVEATANHGNVQVVRANPFRVLRQPAHYLAI